MTFLDSSYQADYKNAPADEIARLVVKGIDFTDWESVWVQVHWNQSAAQFRFTCAERDPLPDHWSKTQFAPGDFCTIYLARRLVINGVIIVRQVAYDANTHGVSLQGVSLSYYAGRGSVMHKTGNFDGKALMPIIHELLVPTDVTAVPVGQVENTPFAQVSVTPGEPIHQAMERLARDRQAIIGSNIDGNFLVIFPYTTFPVATLIEGVNILSCQAVWKNQHYSDYWVYGQKAGTDEEAGRKAAEMKAHRKGTLRQASPLLTPVEHPVKLEYELALRANLEYQWHEGDIWEVTITVYGWLDQTGRLWTPGEVVVVYSPMAMLNGVVLGILTATFTQDSTTGTRTTLTLTQPHRLNNMSVTRPGSGAPPVTPPATSPGGEAETPPAQPVQPSPPLLWPED